MRGSEKVFETLSELVKDLIKRENIGRALDKIPRVYDTRVYDIGYTEMVNQDDEFNDVEIVFGNKKGMDSIVQLKNCSVTFMLESSKLMKPEDFVSYVCQYKENRFKASSEKIMRGNLVKRVSKIFNNSHKILSANKKVIPVSIDLSSSFDETPFTDLIDSINVILYDISIPKFVEATVSKCKNWLLENKDFVFPLIGKTARQIAGEDENEWSDICEEVFHHYSYPSLICLLTISHVLKLNVVLITDRKQQYAFIIENPSPKFAFLSLSKGRVYRPILKVRDK